MVTNTSPSEAAEPSSASSVARSLGASPRASLALLHASSAAAYLRGRDYVTPDDVRELAADCLRHRITLSLDARLQKLSRDAFIAGLVEAVPAP